MARSKKGVGVLLLAFALMVSGYLYAEDEAPDSAGKQSNKTEQEAPAEEGAVAAEHKEEPVTPSAPAVTSPATSESEKYPATPSPPAATEPKKEPVTPASKPALADKKPAKAEQSPKESPPSSKPTSGNKTQPAVKEVVTDTPQDIRGGEDSDTLRTSQELNDKKKEAKSDLEKYFWEDTSENNYTSDQIKTIKDKKKPYYDKIDQCNEIAQIDSVLSEAKQEVDLISVNALLKPFIEKTRANLDKKQDKLGIIEKYLVPVLAAFLALVSLALVIVLYINKADKKRLLEVNTRLQELEERIANTQKDASEENARLRSQINTTSDKIYDLQRAARKQPVELSRADPAPAPVCAAPPPPPPIPDDPIEDFNNWASNPSSSLPVRFYYLRGEPQVRTEQSLTETSEATAWICNRRNGKKYLLPNPCMFDELTDISKFYAMDLTKLRSKGQNKIKVKSPCEMSDKGWIEYPGELDLL